MAGWDLRLGMVSVYRNATIILQKNMQLLVDRKCRTHGQIMSVKTEHKTPTEGLVVGVRPISKVQIGLEV